MAEIYFYYLPKLLIEPTLVLHEHSLVNFPNKLVSTDWFVLRIPSKDLDIGNINSLSEPNRQPIGATRHLTEFNITVPVIPRRKPP